MSFLPFSRLPCTFYSEFWKSNKEHKNNNFKARSKQLMDIEMNEKSRKFSFQYIRTDDVFSKKYSYLERSCLAAKNRIEYEFYSQIAILSRQTMVVKSTSKLLLKLNFFFKRKYFAFRKMYFNYSSEVNM